MPLGYQDLLDAARAEVTSLTVAEAAEMVATGRAVLVDIRDPRELEREGKIEGARHAPRGMLEFWIDPASPYHKPWFAADTTFVFFCASGWRSLLAAQTAQRMGLRCASMLGGFGEWRGAKLPLMR